MNGPATAMAKAPPGTKGGIRAGLLLAGCVCLLALPSAVLAFSATFVGASKTAMPIDSLDPEASDESLSRAVAMRSLAKGQQFPFTAAGTPFRQDRSVTVAVRVDPEAAKAIIVRGHTLTVAPNVPEVGRLRISPAAFNLGVSRGYQNFAQALVPKPAPNAELQELHKFSLSSGSKESEPRFSTRISIDERRVSGRAPRTFAGDAGEVDLGGALRVTDNIDVTAGVRYTQDRERLLPLTDGKQDNQAVYVGTQFRF